MTALLLAVVLTLMVIYYLRWARPKLPRIDPNAPCPSCGNRSGSLSLLHGKDSGGDAAFVQHTCKVCSATWAEATVVPFKHWQIKTPIPVAKK